MPPLGGHHQNIAIVFETEKLTIKKIGGNVQQYRQNTDGRTDILGWHSPCYAYASRGKKLFQISIAVLILTSSALILLTFC